MTPDGDHGLDHEDQQVAEPHQLIDDEIPAAPKPLNEHGCHQPILCGTMAK
jgi:hypothetical protein